MNQELFDALDEDGRRTGKTVSREEAHEKGIYHRAAVMFIVNDKNQVLMQKRSLTKKVWPGCWDMTSGGHLDAGESSEDCVIRETYEEIGVKIESRDIRHIGGYRSNKKFGAIHDCHFNDFFVAHKNVNLKDIKLQRSEVEQIKWVNFADFKRLTQSRDSSLTSKWEAFDSLIRYMESRST
jgi:isopentenyl-diphosphate delta-isomerase type 1